MCQYIEESDADISNYDVVSDGIHELITHSQISITTSPKSKDVGSDQSHDT